MTRFLEVDTLVRQDTSSNTCVGVAPLTYASEDDLATWYCFIAGNGTAPTAPAGWTEVSFTDNDTGGASLYVYWRILQAGDTAPTLTHNFNDPSVNYMLFSPDGTFDAAAPWDATDDDVFSSAATHDCPSVTPTEANCQLITAIVVDSNGGDMTLSSDNARVLTFGDQGAGGVCWGLAISTIPATTATNVVTWRLMFNADGVGFSGLLKDNDPTAGTHSPGLINSAPTTNKLAAMQDYRFPTYGESYRDPTSDITTIDGLSTVYDAPGAGIGFLPWTDGVKTNVTAGSGYTGYEVELSSNEDMSATDYLLNFNINAEAAGINRWPTTDEGGLVITLRSATADGAATSGWDAYIMHSFDNLTFNNAQLCAVLQPSGTSAAGYQLDSGGTLDTSAVKYIGFWLARSTSNITMTIAELGQLNNLAFSGGSSADPITLQKMFIQSARSPTLAIIEQGVKQYACKQTLQFGADGHSSYAQDSGFSVSFEQKTVISDNVLGTNVDDNTFGVEINFDDENFNPVWNLTNGSFSGSDPFFFKMKNYSATPSNNSGNFSGLLISGPGENEMDDVGFAVGGATFVGRDVFDYTLSTMDVDLSGGNVFDNGSGTYQFEVNSQADFLKLANSTIRNQNTAILISGDQSGSWSDASLTVSGNTVDIEYNGATDFSIQSATFFSVSNTSSGTLTRITPTVDLTLNSSESSTLLQIFTTTTQTILDSTTGATLSYTHAGETVDSRAQKAGFLPQSDLNNALSGNETVNFNLVADPVYDASHGLTYTTDASWSRSNNELTVPTFGPSVRSIHSLLIDSFISQTSLRNTDYNISMNGPSALFLIADAEGVNDASIENMTAGGVRYIDASGTATAEWVGIESIGTIPSGATGRYTADGATTTVNARATGKFDEIIKVYGDASHGNFDNRSANDLIMKFQINGYREARVNVQDTYGVSALEPQHYIVAMSPVAIGAATGDPGLTITITDHGPGVVTWNGKDFGITVTDNSTPSSGEDILRELNYNLSQSSTYQGKAPIAWPEMVIEVVAGSSYETLRGYTEDAQPSVLKGVRVVQSDGSTPHPDFVRFQASDGTYFTPATVAQVSAPNLIAGRVQILNSTGGSADDWAATTAYSLGDYVLRTSGLGSELGFGVFFVCTTAGTSGGTEPTFNVSTNGSTTADGTVIWTARPYEFDNAVTTSGYSNSWTNGEEINAGDVIRLKWVDEDDLQIDSSGVATVSGTTTFLDVPADDTVYVGYSLDGATIDATGEYVADFPNVQVDLNDPDNVFYIDRFYSWFKYILTTADGIRNFFGGVDAQNASNLRIKNAIVDIYFDNLKSSSARQGDNILIQRDDGNYPQVTTTTGGGGLGFYYTGVGYTVETGVSGLTSGESSNLALISTVNSKVDIVDTNVDDILLDTSTSIPSQITALNNLSSSEVNAEVDAALSDYDGPTKAELDTAQASIESNLATTDSKVDGVKAKTDQLTFTKANEVDSNIQSVNEVTVTGTGANGDEWGP